AWRPVRETEIMAGTPPGAAPPWPGAPHPHVLAAPALWNPNAAFAWSFLFSPAFGSFLHARNADALGRAEEAAANGKWFIGSLVYLVAVIGTLFVTLPPELDRILNLVPMAILLAWYFGLGKQQAQYVKATWQGHYPRKPWAAPLLIGFGCLVGY